LDIPVRTAKLQSQCIPVACYPKAIHTVHLNLLVFFAKGLMTPSISYDSSVVVDKSAKESWAVMSDQTKMSQWINGFIKTELISGEENTIGAKSNVTIDDNGQEQVIEETITKYKLHELMGMKFSMGFMDMDYEIHFDEADGKTTITSKSTPMGNGIIAKSMISFMTGMMQAQEDENMNNLKQLINTNTTDYFPVPELVEVD